MKTKKVILFIVEGVTDKTSLGSIIDKLVSNDLVKFYITGGDITSDKFTNNSNAVEKVNNHVVRFIDRELGINKDDIKQIVHLIDMDGAFVSDEQIQEADADGFHYTESEIIASSKNKVIQRNKKKREVVNRLIYCPNINGIPYSMYYFSCNLEHVLHKKIDVDDDEKMDYAEDFADSYYKNEESFLDFIKSDEFAVQGDYKETWEFIKLNGNSLKRFSNFHLYFD